MSLTTIFLLAVGLGVDAFSVAIGIGAAHHKKDWAPVLRLSFAFGLFQFVMPLIGWLAGSTVVGLIRSFDHWIAFALLAAVGGKMIREGFEAESDEEKEDQTHGWALFQDAHFVSGGGDRRGLLHDDGGWDGIRENARKNLRQKSGNPGRTGPDRHRCEDIDRTYEVKTEGWRKRHVKRIEYFCFAT